jgi:phospholipid/cholesterol/gamma-HCH transport system substrate-binding protein
MTRRIRLTLAVILSGLALPLSSCAQMGAFGVRAIPVPGAESSGGYDLTLEFANVLNLPDQAKVVMDGTRVGSVKNVVLKASGVDVTVRIDEGVDVPSNIRSVLQQATVLGDTYMALERNTDPNSPSHPLRPDDRIPLSQTTSPPQLEDTLANLANFIGSGSIQRAQNTVIKVNHITPPRPEIRAMATRAATDLSDLSNNIDNADLWLDGFAQSAALMAANTQKFETWFTPLGVKNFAHSFVLVHYMAPLLPTIGSIYYNGYWLVPTLASAAAAVGAIQKGKWAFEEEVHKWERLVTDQIMPQEKYPAINITSIVDSDGRDLTNNVQDVLRMIGATQ